MTDMYKFWRDAVSGVTVSVHPDDPQPGYYWMRRKKGGPRLPVLISPDDGGQIMARIGDAEGVVPAVDVWTYCASNAVTSAAARHAFTHGSWPGDVVDAPSIGHNSGDVPLFAQIEAAKTDAREWLRGRVFSTQADADGAANHAAKINKLAKDLDQQRTDEIRPHLDAQRDINARLKPVIDAAKDAAKYLETAARKWVDAENARRRKEADDLRRNAEDEARARSNAARIEAELARREAADRGDWLEATAPLPEAEPIVIEPVAPVAAVKVGGQFGNRVGGSRKTIEYFVSDYAAFMKANADHPDLKDAADKLARKLGKAGVLCAGLDVRKSGDEVAA